MPRAIALPPGSTAVLHSVTIGGTRIMARKATDHPRIWVHGFVGLPSEHSLFAALRHMETSIGWSDRHGLAGGLLSDLEWVHALVAVNLPQLSEAARGRVPHYYGLDNWGWQLLLLLHRHRAIR